jgi:hypothetical protein
VHNKVPEGAPLRFLFHDHCLDAGALVTALHLVPSPLAELVVDCAARAREVHEQRSEQRVSIRNAHPPGASANTLPCTKLLVHHIGVPCSSRRVTSHTSVLVSRRLKASHAQSSAKGPSRKAPALWTRERVVQRRPCALHSSFEQWTDSNMLPYRVRDSVRSSTVAV